MPIPLLPLLATLLSTAAPVGDLAPHETVRRMAGRLDALTLPTVDGYRSGLCLVDEALPAGYPTPTPPGAIDLKRYPSVRRAEITTDARSGTNGAFFPLFQHISRRGIAMTTPVEVDLSNDDRPTTETMSFLYRTADLGPVGRDGAIRVVDAPPVTVISVGLAGAYGPDTIERGLKMLEEWLDGTTEWQRSGAPRALYYNGPMVSDANKWAEVQIPVRFAGTPTPADAATDRHDTFTSSATPSLPTFLQLVVERGSPLYNAGQPGACVAVYEVAVRSLLGWSATDISPALRRTLREALDAVEETGDARVNAWVLRRALDAAYVEATGS